MTRKLRALTGARGIAAWFVVLFHVRSAITGLPVAVGHVLAKGYLAVDFFFLLSGFVIWLAWHGRIDGMRSVVPFLHRRVARVWPLHLLMLAATVALAALLAATGRFESDYPFAQLPLHVLLIQNWGFTQDLTWNVPAWSISCELAAYLLFPLLAMRIDWRRWPGWALGATGIALAVGLHATMRPVQTLGQAIPTLGLARCLFEFTAGTIVCALWLRLTGPRAFAASGAIAGGLAVAWALGAAETLVVPGMLAAALLALALSSGWRGNPFETRGVHYLGDISYATYLGHFLLWKAFKLAFVSQAHAIPPALLIAYLLAVFGSSVALYHLFERPAQHWVNALGAGRTTAGPAGAVRSRRNERHGDVTRPVRPPAQR